MAVRANSISIKVLQVSNLDALPRVQRPASELLIDGEYFRTWRHQLQHDRLDLRCEGQFQALTCITGSLIVEAEGHETVELALGDTGLIPACLPAFSLRGSGVVLRSCQR